MELGWNECWIDLTLITTTVQRRALAERCSDRDRYAGRLTEQPRLTVVRERSSSSPISPPARRELFFCERPLS